MSKSALPRIIDLKYPSNRYAAGGLLAGVLLSRATGRGWGQAITDGLAGFSAWAIARELDPDYNQAAALALPLGYAAAFLEQPGAVARLAPQAWPVTKLSGANLIGSFAALISLRVLAGTVGLKPLPQDIVTLTLGAGISALAGEKLAAALLAVALGGSALLRDQFSPAPAAALSGLVVVLPALSHGQRVYSSTRPATAVSVAALLLGPRLTQPEQIVSACDQIPAKVTDNRVRHARQMAVGTLVLGLLLGRSGSFGSLAAAALSVGLRRSFLNN